MKLAKATQLAVFTLLTMVSTIASAQSVFYKVGVKTGGQDGTTNDCYIRFEFDDGLTDWMRLHGKHDRNSDYLDAPVELSLPFKGATKRIALMVKRKSSFQAPDAWTPHSVRVYCPHNEKIASTDTEHYAKITYNVSGKISEGEPNAMLLSPSSFDNMFVPPPKLSGEPQSRDVEVIKVYYAANNASSPDTANRLVEKWTDIKAFGVSTTKSSEVGVGATLAYESPETVAGTFSAEITASYTKFWQDQKEKSEQHVKESEIDSAFPVAPYSWVFKKRTYLIPEKFALYVAADGGRAGFYVRTVEGNFSKPVYEETLEISKAALEFRGAPIPWSDIAEHWLRYMDEASQKAVLRDKPSWVRNGFVVEGPPVSPVPGSTTEVSLNEVLGDYQLQPATNDWHTGRIAMQGGRLVWTNKAGITWILTPDLSNKMLRTGNDNPYQSSGGRDFTIEVANGQVTGFRFIENFYKRIPSRGLQVSDVVGKYQFQPATDEWHTGQITMKEGRLTWTNKAGVSWTLTPDLEKGALRTGNDNPYHNSGIRDFFLEVRNGQIVGFKFNEQLYHRTGQ